MTRKQTVAGAPSNSGAPVTYSLRAGGTTSEEYYGAVGKFTDEVLSYAAGTVGPVVGSFSEYVRTYRLEAVRTTEEYTLELLTFGIFWNLYGGYALRVTRAPFATLARLGEARKRHQSLKPAIDLARGILTTVFLLPGKGAKGPDMLPMLREVDRLSRWLDATGEFREQALRFIRWRAYWETLPVSDQLWVRERVFDFAGWFTARSEQVLGSYTANVNTFLERNAGRYRWREDRISCMRSRAEYHLNMVGAEVLNRAFQTAYRETALRVVLVPGCMRKRQEKECEAIREREGLRCKGCERECHVNRLREMGVRRGFDVYIIPHASDLSLWSPRPGRPRRGVIASACVTTLVEGGWELKRYDVPAQCVLLDASGCRKHWHCEGVPTDFNVRELKRILSQK
jgi:hypothetical protein